MNYGRRFVTLYRRQGSRPSPWKRNAKSWRFSSPLPPWHSGKEDRKINEDMTTNYSSVKRIVVRGGQWRPWFWKEGSRRRWEKNKRKRERTSSRWEGQEGLSEGMLQNEEEPPLEGRVRCSCVSQAWTHGRDLRRGVLGVSGEPPHDRHKPSAWMRWVSRGGRGQATRGLSARLRGWI